MTRLSGDNRRSLLAIALLLFVTNHDCIASIPSEELSELDESALRDWLRTTYEKGVDPSSQLSAEGGTVADDGNGNNDDVEGNESEAGTGTKVAEMKNGSEDDIVETEVKESEPSMATTKEGQDGKNISSVDRSDSDQNDATDSQPAETKRDAKVETTIKDQLVPGISDEKMIDDGKNTTDSKVSSHGNDPLVDSDQKVKNLTSPVANIPEIEMEQNNSEDATNTTKDESAEIVSEASTENVTDPTMEPSSSTDPVDDTGNADPAIADTTTPETDAEIVNGTFAATPSSTNETTAPVQIDDTTTQGNVTDVQMDGSTDGGEKEKAKKNKKTKEEGNKEGKQKVEEKEEMKEEGKEETKEEEKKEKKSPKKGSLADFFNKGNEKDKKRRAMYDNATKEKPEPETSTKTEPESAPMKDTKEPEVPKDATMTTETVQAEPETVNIDAKTNEIISSEEEPEPTNTTVTTIKQPANETESIVLDVDDKEYGYTTIWGKKRNLETVDKFLPPDAQDTTGEGNSSSTDGGSTGDSGSANATNDGMANGTMSEIRDANALFVEGLDDIDKFFQKVDAPDELEPGAIGSSLQEILVGQGVQILRKRAMMIVERIRKFFTRAPDGSFVLVTREEFEVASRVVLRGLQEGWSRIQKFVDDVFDQDNDNDELTESFVFDQDQNKIMAMKQKLEAQQRGSAAGGSGAFADGNTLSENGKLEELLRKQMAGSR